MSIAGSASQRARRALMWAAGASLLTLGLVLQADRLPAIITAYSYISVQYGLREAHAYEWLKHRDYLVQRMETMPVGTSELVFTVNRRGPAHGHDALHFVLVSDRDGTLLAEHHLRLDDVRRFQKFVSLEFPPLVEPTPLALVIRADTPGDTGIAIVRTKPEVKTRAKGELWKGTPDALVQLPGLAIWNLKVRRFISVRELVHRASQYNPIKGSALIFLAWLVVIGTLVWARTLLRELRLPRSAAWIGGAGCVLVIAFVLRSGAAQPVPRLETGTPSKLAAESLSIATAARLGMNHTVERPPAIPPALAP